MHAELAVRHLGHTLPVRATKRKRVVREQVAPLEIDVPVLVGFIRIVVLCPTISCSSFKVGECERSKRPDFVIQGNGVVGVHTVVVVVV